MARSRSISCIAVVAPLGALLAGPGCEADGGRCGSLARLCEDDGRWRVVFARVEDAAVLDLDGDGEDEHVALSYQAGQLAVAHASGQRSVLHFDATPAGLEALPGEVAVALTEPPGVAIFGLDGDGRIERRRDVPLASEPLALLAVDLAGDGAPELIASLPDRGQLAVIDPRAGTVRELAAGGAPAALASGDIDGDGRIDVVAYDWQQRALQVLRGGAGGQLQAAQAQLSAAEVAALVLADHDGDGDLDAIGRAGARAIAVQRNDGAGRFSSPTALTLTREPEGRGLAAGPVAAGGLVGVSVPQGGGGVGTWFGKGAALLGHLEAYTGNMATSVGAGPDGDLLVGGLAFLRRFAYEAGAAPVEVWRTDAVSSDYGDVALATGDLDGDHLLDFAVAVGGTLHLLRGRADLGFDVAQELPLEGPATALVIADVTGDGRADIVVNEDTRLRLVYANIFGGYDASSSFAVGVPALTLLSLRTGPNTPPAIAALPVPGRQNALEPGASVLRFADGVVTETAIAADVLVDRLIGVDFDADGVDEPLILGRREEVALLTRLTPAGSGFDPGAEHDLGALSGETPDPMRSWSLATGDLDGDGAPEVMAAIARSSLTIAGLEADAPVVTVEPEVLAPTHLRDVDGDGLLDAARLTSYSFGYRRGLGDGTLAETSHYYEFPRADELAFAGEADAQFDIVQLGLGAVSTHLLREVVRPVPAGDPVVFHGEPGELAVADLDGDGCDDVVTVSGFGGRGIAWMWGAEDDPLARVDGVSLVGPDFSLAIGDLDGDGVAEVLSAGITHGVRVHRVRPPFAVEDLALDEVPGGIGSMAVADLDGDDRQDIIALGSESGQAVVEVAYGEGSMKFAPWTRASAVPSSTYSTLGVGDVDGDGDVDLLISVTAGPGDPPAGHLVRASGPREWAEPVELAGVAMFSAPDARGRVELISQDGPTIDRLVNGDPDRRTALVSGGDDRLIAAGDADGDGDTDLAVVGPHGSFVWVRDEDGDRRVAISELPLRAVAFPDIDGDRRPDLVGVLDGGLWIRRTRP